MHIAKLVYNCAGFSHKMETYYHWKRQYASLMYKYKQIIMKSVPKYRSNPYLLSSYPLSLLIPGYIICFTCLAITTFFYSSKVSLLLLALLLLVYIFTLGSKNIMLPSTPPIVFDIFRDCKSFNNDISRKSII